MAENKTQENDQSVDDFLNKIENERKRNDSFAILAMMKRITETEPKMWGDSMIGFGKYEYKYKSGREGEWFKIGFSPRKQNLTIYLYGGFDNYQDILKDLGKFKTSVGCLYVNHLKDINLDKLEELIQQSFLKSIDNNL